MIQLTKEADQSWRENWMVWDGIARVQNGQLSLFLEWCRIIAEFVEQHSQSPDIYSNERKGKSINRPFFFEGFVVASIRCRKNAAMIQRHTNLFINASSHIEIQHLGSTVLKCGMVVDLLLEQLDILDALGYIVTSEDIGGCGSEITEFVVVVGEENVFDLDVPMQDWWIRVVHICNGLNTLFD